MISQNVFNKLVKNGLTIAFAESMTGGKVTYELIKNPGSSKVIQGSIIAYSNEEKQQLLNVNSKSIEKYSSVSKEVAIEMATNVKRIMNASIGVGITGNAGPTLQDETNTKEVFIAIISDDFSNTYNINLNELTRLKSIQKTNHFIYEKLNELI